MSDEKEESEFGSGIVVCLAKFSEHLGNRHMEAISHAICWMANPDRHAEWRTMPIQGDHARFMTDVTLLEIFEKVDAPGRGLSQMIWMWMNGASDHFYDLDRKRAPAQLVELADLVLSIGHGFLEHAWTKETVDKIFQLWKDSCLAVDEQLGVQSGEWGRW